MEYFLGQHNPLDYFALTLGKLPVPAKKRAAVFTPPPWENTVLAELDLFCLFRLKIVLQIIDIVACGIAQNAAL